MQLHYLPWQTCTNLQLYLKLMFSQIRPFELAK